VLTETLRGYLDDRQGLRAHVAALTGRAPREAKQLINSLFNGARLGKNARWSAFQLLGYDDAAMDRLTSDPQVRRLTTEIARVWRRIEGARRLARPPTLAQALSPQPGGSRRAGRSGRCTSRTSARCWTR
jgi:hypothetical protein